MKRFLVGILGAILIVALMCTGEAVAPVAPVPDPLVGKADKVVRLNMPKISADPEPPVDQHRKVYGHRILPLRDMLRQVVEPR